MEIRGCFTRAEGMAPVAVKRLLGDVEDCLFSELGPWLWQQCGRELAKVQLVCLLRPR